MPKPRKVILARTIGEAEEKIQLAIKFQIGQGAFTTGSAREIEAGKHIVELGMVAPHVTRDPVTGEGSVTFFRYPRLATAEIARKGDQLQIQIPQRKLVLEALQREETTILFRAEAAFMNSAEENLARSPIIQNALNPVKEILVSVREMGDVSDRQFKDHARYLPFLAGLRYIEHNENRVRPGPMLEQFDFFASESQYPRILGDIIREGYEYLAGPLNIRHLVAYVRTANSYFWPSHQVGRPLEFRLEDFRTYMRRLYRGYNPSQVKIFNHVDDLTRVGVFKMDGNRRVAEPVIWNRFEAKAPAVTA